MKITKRIFTVILVLFLLAMIIEYIASLLQKPNIVNIDRDADFLLKTTWHQTEDYAKYVEYDDDAGCWATAIAQIAHFHRLTPAGKVYYQTSEGKHISINLDEFSFDHNLFVTQIGENTSPASKDQLARYLYYIAALIYTDFGSSGYLEHKTMMSRIEKHLHCRAEFHEFKKESYLKARSQIQKLIKGGKLG